MSWSGSLYALIVLTFFGLAFAFSRKGLKIKSDAETKPPPCPMSDASRLHRYIDMTGFRTLDQADVANKRVLAARRPQRADGERPVSDATRIERIAPTITEIADKGGKVILLSHLGRPKGPDPKESLKPVAAAVAAIIGRPVGFRRGLHRPEGRSRRRAPCSPATSCAWRTRASTKARRRTTRHSSMRWRSSATSGSTTPSRPRIARMPRPKGSATSCRPMRAAPCRPSLMRSARRWRRRSARWRRSWAAPRSRPSSTCSAT